MEMALYVICGKIWNAFRNLFAGCARCVSPDGVTRNQATGLRRMRAGLPETPFRTDFSAPATINQKANAAIFRRAAFHPQQIALTHVNQLSAPPLVPVAKRSASIIVRLT
ncbi:hypothetical protein [Sinorhizobium americanum]|uniref:hypothetical protein n=1 Tax=Sinorhizobium americanum TaxID=194963 RepID=UPI0010503697|nr:hypothetical protein [Sinorhizobium americanum]